MEKSKFMKSGHFPTLLAAFLYFDVSFMVWVLLGPLAPFLSQQFHLTSFLQKPCIKQARENSFSSR